MTPKPDAAKAKWTPEMIAEHKAMMSGVPDGPVGKAGADSKDYEANHAYRKAFEEHVGHFINGNMKDAAGETVQHREDALTQAHVHGLKAVQALRKGGMKMRVFAD